MALVVEAEAFKLHKLGIAPKIAKLQKPFTPKMAMVTMSILGGEQHLNHHIPKNQPKATLPSHLNYEKLHSYLIMRKATNQMDVKAFENKMVYYQQIMILRILLTL